MILNKLKKWIPQKLIRRFKWQLASNRFVSGQDQWAKNAKYDKELEIIVNSELAPSSNALDIGASIGTISLILLDKLKKGKVYSFEPIPESFDSLKKSLAKYPNSKAYNLAVSENSGSVEFNVLEGNKGLSSLRVTDKLNNEINKGHTTIKVRTVSIDFIIPDDEIIDFIKIDVEGAEYKVLKGAAETIKRSKPVIFFEFESHAKAFGTTPEMMFELLNELGLSVYNTGYYMQRKEPYSLSEFVNAYNKEYETYFVAAPTNR